MSSFPLFPNPPVSLRNPKLRALSLLSFSKPSTSLSFSKSHICFSSSIPDSSSSDPQDLLWLREEQRWLREEQRWLREEQRWLRERESLLSEIQSLKLQIQNLEKRILVQDVDLVPDSVANVSALLQVLTEKNRIAESGSSASPIVLEEEEVELGEAKQVISVSEKEEKKTWRTLRKGSEGEEVRQLQEALQTLGFYSGEEDMEFSSFSSGTERAVKTWQASLSVPDDGIMTTELLERLYMEPQTKSSRSKFSMDEKGINLTVSQEKGVNGAAAASAIEISEVQQKVVKEEGPTEFQQSQHRVFLLGENRWEEPSRLIKKDKVAHKARNTMRTCMTCRGEGRLLCTECDGSGEPNIEEQFMEWIEEGAKCPYCEGQGFTDCDVCEGKTMV